MTDFCDFPTDSQQSSCLPVGRLAGHYEFKKRLAEGGYGEVFEAWDHKLQRSVAIKRMRKQESVGPIGNSMREARMAASLQHASFVKVYAVEDDGANQLIVMELVPGQTIRQLSADRPIPQDTALDWVAQVAAAMHDAHASGLVHGDLKPSNLMVEAAGRVRILDFGLAVRHDALSTGALDDPQPSGTIAYMAPERLQGAPPDVQSDVYALGIVLYELACGARPYPGLDGLALAAACLQSNSATWPYPASLPAGLVALIHGMTMRRPQQRLATMAEVQRKLLELSAKPGAMPRARRAWHWPARRWLLAGGAVLASAVLCVGAWQLSPHVAALLEHAAPYSPTLEMQAGLEALRQFDRPGATDQAGRHFARVLEHTPGNAAAVAGMSLVYSLRYTGDSQDEVWLQKAAASAQQALKLNDQLALSHIANGGALDALGRHEPALQAYAQALRLDPGNYFAWYGKILALRHAGRLADALQNLKQASARFPQERVFADELGAVYYEQGEYSLAEQAFRRSIALQPDSVVAYANLNAVLLGQNRQDEALRLLQQGLQIRPSAQLYGNLGNAFFMRGDYVQAVAAFENAVSPSHGAPGEYLNWANLADALLLIPGREPQARQAYDKARHLLAPRLARAPDDVTLVSRMGLYAARSGDTATAKKMLAHAVALAPDNASLQFRVGLAYELLGNRQMALAAILKSRRLGYPSKFIEAEPDLVALRRDPGYPQD